MCRMPTCVVDLDGTISAYPTEMCDLMCALKSTGYTVVILSGSGDDPKSGNTFEDKCDLLKTLGVTQCWDTMVVVGGDIAALKAQWCKENNVSIMIDNNLANCKAALKSGVTLALVPWASVVTKE